MCLAIPMQIVRIDGAVALVEEAGVTREVRIDFLPDVQAGDYVLVHAGVAIERIDEDEAAETLRMLKVFLDEVC